MAIIDDRKLKTAKQMERHFKGMGNHYRIAILLLLADQPGLTLSEIIKILDAHMKTISQHTRYLVQAGLLLKKYKGRNVLHSLSPYGKVVVRFIRQFQTISSRTLPV